MSVSTSSHSTDALWQPALSPTGDARAQRGRPDWTDIVFFLLLAVGAGYALTGYGSAMDYYEKIILCGAVFYVGAVATLLYLFRDSYGSCHRIDTTANAGALTAYQEGADCPDGRNRLLWSSHPDGSPDSLGWTGQ